MDQEDLEDSAVEALDRTHSEEPVEAMVQEVVLDQVALEALVAEEVLDRTHSEVEDQAAG